MSEFIYANEALKVCSEFQEAWQFFVSFMRIIILPFVTDEQLKTAQEYLCYFLEEYPDACAAQCEVWLEDHSRRKQQAEKRRRLNNGSKQTVDPKPRVENFVEDACVKPNMHFIIHLTDHIRSLGTAISAYVCV